ncbi:MAG TPA: hypothetical protein VNH21_14870, partial [Steroidobacteraceae bacterium]|nr:hypothetical protein [Steroidobacteraceae bacterium]
MKLQAQSAVFVMLMLTLALQSGTAAPAIGETVLDNSRVLVQKFVVPPGQSIDRRGGSGDQLLVFVKGGMLTSREGRATVWRDGRVLWRDAGTSSDLGGSTNTG